MDEEPIMDPLVEQFYWEMVEGIGRVMKEPDYTFEHSYVTAADIVSFFHKIGGTLCNTDTNGWQADAWYTICHEDKKYCIFTSAYAGGVEFSAGNDNDDD